VLNGYTDITESTRQRVLSAVKELGFTPNRAARSFRTGKTNTVSVFLPRIGDWFYDYLISAIDTTLADQDYDAALFPLLSERRLIRYRSADALPYQSDGVIMASLNPESLFPDARLPASLPTVLVDAYHGDFDSITIDNRGGARTATSRLLDQGGDTYIVMVNDYDKEPFSSGVFIERLAGFKEALALQGISDFDRRIALCEFSRIAAKQCVQDILSSSAYPVNIFSCCDSLARGVIDAVKDHGLRLGTDVRVISFDDQPWAQNEELSTVKQPIDEMGRLAAEILFWREEHPDALPRHIELPVELIVRQSG
jgi:LacI family transcriptional regulator